MEPRISIKEKLMLVIVFSLLIVPALYYYIVYRMYVEANPALLYDLQFHGKAFLVLVPVIVVTLIVIHIIFAIVNKIFTNEDIPSISDEMDKLIDLKAMRISRWVSSLSFLLAFGVLAMGYQAWVMLLVFVASCFVAGIAESIAKFYYYRKGI